jgi:DNA-binding transcriptional ArsR family regulator
MTAGTPVRRISRMPELDHVLSPGCPKTSIEMVVDHTDSLHEGIDDGRPYELPSACAQRLGQSLGLGRRDRIVAVRLRPRMPHRLVRPHEVDKRLACVVHCEQCLGIDDGRGHLLPIANDAGIRQQPLNVGRPIGRHLRRIESIEGTSITLALAQDGDPGQTSLCTVEDEFLEQFPLIADGPTPVVVVIRDVQRVVPRPTTTNDAVGPGEKLRRHRSCLPVDGDIPRAGLTPKPPVLTYNQMVVQMELSDAEVDRIFRALADATRRDIVRRTLAGEASVSELATAYDMSWAAVQKHVAVLEGAELVTKEARGRERIVRGNPTQIQRAQALLDTYEQIWRARIDRLDALLAGDDK